MEDDTRVGGGHTEHGDTWRMKNMGAGAPRRERTYREGAWRVDTWRMAHGGRARRMEGEHMEG